MHDVLEFSRFSYSYMLMAELSPPSCSYAHRVRERYTTAGNRQPCTHTPSAGAPGRTWVACARFTEHGDRSGIYPKGQGGHLYLVYIWICTLSSYTDSKLSADRATVRARRETADAARHGRLSRRPASRARSRTCATSVLKPPESTSRVRERVRPGHFHGTCRL